MVKAKPYYHCTLFFKRTFEPIEPPLVGQGVAQHIHSWIIKFNYEGSLPTRQPQTIGCCVQSCVLLHFLAARSADGFTSIGVFDPKDSVSDTSPSSTGTSKFKISTSQGQAMPSVLVSNSYPGSPACMVCLSGTLLNVPFIEHHLISCEWCQKELYYGAHLSALLLALSTPVAARTFASVCTVIWQL